MRKDPPEAASDPNAGAVADADVDALSNRSWSRSSSAFPVAVSASLIPSIFSVCPVLFEEDVEVDPEEAVRVEYKFTGGWGKGRAGMCRLIVSVAMVATAASLGDIQEK